MKTSPAAPPSQPSTRPSSVELVPSMEKENDDLRGQPQESGRLGQRLQSTWGSPCTCRATPGLPSTKSAWPTAFCPRTGPLPLLGCAALGTLNWASLPEGAYTGPQQDHQQPERRLQRQQAHSKQPGAASNSRRGGLPAAPPASSTKPFSVDQCWARALSPAGSRSLSL